MNSTNHVQNLVLTRKLNPSEKQRRKQLIAEAAKLPNNSKRNNKTPNSHNSSASDKSVSCFGAKDQTDSKAIYKSSNSKESSQIPNIDLMDTGFLCFINLYFNNVLILIILIVHMLS